MEDTEPAKEGSFVLKRISSYAWWLHNMNIFNAIYVLYVHLQMNHTIKMIRTVSFISCIFYYNKKISWYEGWEVCNVFWGKNLTKMVKIEN